ncbi:immunoglobulin-like domain-containing protein [Planomicrobium okeanokoites]|uniref:immunoglobulin-like domain-containing protein n=1 Tax=Planomicrobium okeanokoites TaxID=244 RepID=UPI000A01446F|nr:immunoglobulin-like domain-containing protein [Planomicrobium okeanokoites]
MRFLKSFSLLVALFLIISACSNSETNISAKLVGTESLYKNKLSNKLNIENASLAVSTDKENYLIPVEKINFIIENTGSTSFGYGETLFIEKLESGTWYQLPYSGIGFTDEINELKPKEKVIQELPLKYLNFHLTKGTYRITKEISYKREIYPLGVEFEIR